jgi:hypothetical protein
VLSKSIGGERKHDALRLTVLQYAKPPGKKGSGTRTPTSRIAAAMSGIIALASP